MADGWTTLVQSVVGFENGQRLYNFKLWNVYDNDCSIGNLRRIVYESNAIKVSNKKYTLEVYPVVGPTGITYTNNSYLELNTKDSTDSNSLTVSCNSHGEERTISSVSVVALATRDNEVAGLLYNTKVWVDFRLEAYSDYDQYKLESREKGVISSSQLSLHSNKSA